MCVCVCAPLLWCARVHSCVCQREERIALPFGCCWRKHLVRENISVLANIFRLWLKIRYWPVSLVHLCFEGRSSVTKASESFYDCYNNHKNRCLTGQIIPVWQDFIQQLEESRSVKPAVKAASPCFKELLTHLKQFHDSCFIRRF